MSFSTSVPNDSQSPGVFPAQNRTNMGRLKTIIDQDHVFNDTQDDTTDGIHKKVSLQTRSGLPIIPSGAASVLFTQADGGGTPQLHFYNGTDYALTPLVQPAVSILATVNFNGGGVIASPQFMRSSYGVGDVIKVNTGIFRINFSPELANNNYIVSICIMRQQPIAANQPGFGCVANANTYLEAVKTASLLINTVTENGSLVDPLMVSVTIFGVT